MSRQIEVTNDLTLNREDIISMIQEKGDIVVKGRELSAQKEEIENQLNTCGLDINKINDKLVPLVTSIPVELGEFEQIQSVEIVEDKLMMTIYDQVEEIKEMIRKNKAAQTEAPAETPTEEVTQ